MKLLFVHDHKFYKENNDFYSSGGLPKNIWSRYLDFCSSIIVIPEWNLLKMRVVCAAVKIGLVPSETEGFDGVWVEGCSGKRHQMIYQEIIFYLSNISGDSHESPKFQLISFLFFRDGFVTDITSSDRFCFEIIFGRRLPYR